MFGDYTSWVAMCQRTDVYVTRSEPFGLILSSKRKKGCRRFSAKMAVDKLLSYFLMIYHIFNLWRYSPQLDRTPNLEYHIPTT